MGALLFEMVHCLLALCAGLLIALLGLALETIGHLVASAADQLVFTAGRRDRGGQQRYSIPTIFNLGYHTLASCLPTCQSADNPAKYEPISFHDYAVWYATKNYVHQQKG